MKKTKMTVNASVPKTTSTPLFRRTAKRSFVVMSDFHALVVDRLFLCQFSPFLVKPLLRTHLWLLSLYSHNHYRQHHCFQLSSSEASRPKTTRKKTAKAKRKFHPRALRAVSEMELRSNDVKEMSLMRISMPKIDHLMLFRYSIPQSHHQYQHRQVYCKIRSRASMTKTTSVATARQPQPSSRYSTKT